MEEIVYSPMGGKAVLISDVPDDMFAEKMLGDGMAIVPKDPWITSPVNGTITMVYETQHAIGITTDSGNEILIHIGLDTVRLKGKPFSTKVKVGQKVQVGDELVKVNWRYITFRKYNPITPVININRKEILPLCSAGQIQKGTPLFKIVF